MRLKRLVPSSQHTTLGGLGALPLETGVQGSSSENSICVQHLTSNISVFKPIVPRPIAFTLFISSIVKDKSCYLISTDLIFLFIFLLITGGCDHQTDLRRLILHMWYRGKVGDVNGPSFHPVYDAILVR